MGLTKQEYQIAGQDIMDCKCDIVVTTKCTFFSRCILIVLTCWDALLIYS